MTPYFLFPADWMNERKLDETFRDQATALSTAGYNYAVISLESERITSLHGYPTPLGKDEMVYRGWMLSETEYDRLIEIVDIYGGNLITSKTSYYITHHIPNWYALIGDLTAPTMYLSNEMIASEEQFPASVKMAIDGLGWKKFIVKDYVKSLKTGGGSFLYSCAGSVDITRVIDDMRKYRGTIEGGICVRKFEEYIPQTEIRFFVVNGIPYGPKGIDPNIKIIVDNEYYKLAAEVARRIRVPFFSVDIALREDLVPRVIECGDGQVSDLVGWTPEEFAQIWV